MILYQMDQRDCRATKLDKAQARKLISTIVLEHRQNIIFSRHALVELEKDCLVVCFQSNGQGLVIVTAWDKRNKEERV